MQSFIERSNPFHPSRDGIGHVPNAERRSMQLADTLFGHVPAIVSRQKRIIVKSRRRDIKNSENKDMSWAKDSTSRIKIKRGFYISGRSVWVEPENSISMFISGKPARTCTATLFQVVWKNKTLLVAT